MTKSKWARKCSVSSGRTAPIRRITLPESSTPPLRNRCFAAALWCPFRKAAQRQPIICSLCPIPGCWTATPRISCVSASFWWWLCWFWLASGRRLRCTPKRAEWILWYRPCSSMPRATMTHRWIRPSMWEQSWRNWRNWWKLSAASHSALRNPAASLSPMFPMSCGHRWPLSAAL